jgi:hypothetical protein
VILEPFAVAVLGLDRHRCLTGLLGHRQHAFARHRSELPNADLPSSKGPVEARAIGLGGEIETGGPPTRPRRHDRAQLTGDLEHDYGRGASPGATLTNAGD